MEKEGAKMTSKAVKIFSAFAAVLFFAAEIFAAPVPGGKGSIGSYNSPMQNTRTTSNVSFPYPTNRWFGSIYIKNPYHNYSLRMSASPWLVNLNTNSTGAAAGNGYVLGYPLPASTSASMADRVVNDYNPQFIARIRGIKRPASVQLQTSESLLDGYSDWSATFLCVDSDDNTKWIKTTIGKGFVFTYNEFSENLDPTISSFNNTPSYAYDLNGNALSGTTAQGDCILVKTSPDINGRVVYYAVYAPENTSFVVGGLNIDISFDSSDRYISLALITAGPDDTATKNNAVTIFNDYRQYAYNFITDTKVSYVFDRQNSKVSTTFNFTTTAKRAGFPGGTVFALFPHQWKNTSAPLKPDTYNFKTIRGTMKVGAGSSFVTENKFYGIMPNLTYEVPDTSKNIMQNYINTDKNFDPEGAQSDTYWAGKAFAKAANLIPVFHQFGDIAARNRMIEQLRKILRIWYTYNGQSSKYFGYDSNWGGLIGRNPSYGSENYADHHFHYGYFIYASAILALFDKNFADAGEYKGMVDMIVKNIYNPAHNDLDFPFLRNFDVYEGHSWANGAGGTNDRGIDQESSSEAMNAWAGIYLWGLASNNQAMTDLGAYGYTTEYEAVKEYYFDTSGDIYGGTPYAHKGVGILWDNWVEYNIYFTPVISQTIKGIQILPLTPSMLYLGYDAPYAQSYYSEMLAGADLGANANLWKDIWLRYKSLFDGAGAVSDFIAGGFAAEEGSSLTFSYQFINFFNKYGTVDTGVRADNESFCVMNKGGQKSYMAFNPSTDSYKTVNFKTVSGGAPVGSMKVPPMTTAVTQDFTNFKYDSLRTMYCDGNNYALIMDVYSDGFTIVPSSPPAIDVTQYKILPFSFEVNYPSSTLNGVKSYIHLAGADISPYGAGNIKAAFYNSETGLPDKAYPEQSITVESESGGIADVTIEAILTKTGVYVLLIHTGSSVVSGTLLNAKDGSNASAVMQIYNSADKSTATKTVNGLYEIGVMQGVSYMITPVSENFAFEPANFLLTASDSDITQNFTAFEKYMLSGRVLFNAKGMGNIKVSVYDAVSGSTQTVITAGDGRYTADMYYSRSYVAAPVSSEYDFFQPSLAFNSVVASALNADFYAQIAAGRFVAYPNPYKPSRHGNTGITFTGLKQGAEIKIYNIAGELVFDKKITDETFTWYAENNAGYRAASGVYIYHIKSGGKTKKGKLVIER
ncbi:MAG: glycosyl hydrolase [Endomicrobia bacterium]|nr:glycosyl hydrolase [Endomicrobiia bacterium]